MAITERKFLVHKGWQVLFKDLGISSGEVLNNAELPPDLFRRKSANLSTAEYFRFWSAATDLIGNTTFPLAIVEGATSDALAPPILASLCCANLNEAMERLGQYKPLIGPLRMEMAKDSRCTAVTLTGLPDDIQPPYPFLATEILFMIAIARRGTRERIVPLSVQIDARKQDLRPIEDYAGVRVRFGDTNTVVFSAADARQPFITANLPLLSILDPELQRQLKEVADLSGYRDRVRSCLVEMLPSGQYAMHDVARRLGVSTRTLHRRLSAEGSNFQQELNGLRDDLARSYLTSSDYSSAEISFLLGYEDPNSFIRGFHARNGVTPQTVRPTLRQ